MPELPTTFGKYFLTEKLATGGMAEIYLAKLVGPGGFEKQLVIKQIHPKLSGQRHFVDLFVAEAKTLVTLAHGNIVPVYELGVVDDTYYIAMDYIDGPTLYRLTEMLSRRDAVMAPDVAAWITARILEGLDYAHRKGEGVIHRDLSPRNVMLSRDGEVKIVDFGIAVTLGDGGEDAAQQSAPTGSFPYMSPEQVRKEQLTGQTDLFSVGVLCWEMLVGHRLFSRNDPDATLAAVTESDIPRPSSQRPEIPARLDEVVMRALERDKTARWPTAGDMLAALQRYLYSLDHTPGPRDVAALVARYCPPETRRVPTHAESPFEPDGEPDGDHTVGADAGAGADEPRTPVRGDRTEPAPPPAGPRTAVIPREGSQPRGKARHRQKSFATHVELKDMLDKATPMFGVEAIDEGELPTTTIEAPKVPSAAEPPPAPPAGAADEPAAPDTTLRLRARGGADATAPSQVGLIVIGLGGVALAIASVVVFLRARSAGFDQPDAAPKYDAPFWLLTDAGPDAPPERDAASQDAGPLATDGGDVIDTPATPADAGTPVPPRDGGRPVPRPDATGAGEPAVDARVTAPAGTATLKIGADPWGDIVIDGVRRGRTPATLEVSAGKHVVEVIFGGEDPPRKKTFPVELTTGGMQQLDVDFTRP